MQAAFAGASGWLLLAAIVALVRHHLVASLAAVANCLPRRRRHRAGAVFPGRQGLERVDRIFPVLHGGLAVLRGRRAGLGLWPCGGTAR